MEKLDYELESLIETVSPQIEGSLAIVKGDDWAEIEFFDEKKATHDLHFLLVDKNINYAIKIQTLATSTGTTENSLVKDTIKNLLEFYTVHKERHDRYHSSFDMLSVIATKGKKPRGTIIDEDGIGKPKARRSALSLADNEVKFGLEISEKMVILTHKFKKLSDIDNPNLLVIPTFNDTPIPLVMRKSVEKRYPQIEKILKNKEE